MKRLDDLSLIAQVLIRKDKEAFGKLVRKYQSPVRRLFLHLTCGDGELSDDLAQETFIKAYTTLASFRNLSGFSTWLYRIAYNQFYDYVRSRKVTETLDDGEPYTERGATAESVERKIDVYRSLKMLKEEERVCITLFYIEDLSIDKIAGITKMPAGTVKSHLARGKEKLANYLKRNGYERNR